MTVLKYEKPSRFYRIWFLGRRLYVLNLEDDNSIFTIYNLEYDNSIFTIYPTNLIVTIEQTYSEGFKSEKASVRLNQFKKKNILNLF